MRRLPIESPTRLNDVGSINERLRLAFDSRIIRDAAAMKKPHLWGGASRVQAEVERIKLDARRGNSSSQLRPE